jgi:hypothetical protein
MIDQALGYAYVQWRYRAVARVLHQARDARRIQQEVLLSKIRRHASSRFGQEHGFDEIRSVADFRRRVPVTDYAYYRPYIDRLRQGDIGAMFGPGTKLLMFALTSGTTDKCKYIPITQRFFEEYREGWNLWGVCTYRDHPDLARKKTLKLGSNWRQSWTEGGIPVGAISGLVAETAPLIARSRFVMPRDVYAIDDPALKHYTALRLSLADRRVGMVGTANPSTLIELARTADTRCEDLIRDIHDGTLWREADLPPAVRRGLRRSIHRRHRRRARELEHAVARAGQLLPRDAWPGLSVLAVWTGGSVGVYLPKLRELYGTAAVRDHGLNASEARMTLPLCDESSSGVIEFMHHFFEFIPVGEHDTQQPPVLQAHELEVGRDYFILLTNSAGLYRYDIHDVVRCVDFEGEAPVLTFLNKGAHFSSITGEKLSEHQVVAAVRAAFAELELPSVEFTVAPVMAERPGYVLLIEEGPHRVCWCQLAESIDQHLQESNYEYAEKRRTNRLEPVTIRDLPTGTWRALREQRSIARGNFEEYKHCCLVNDLNYADRLPAACADRLPTISTPPRTDP